MMHDWACTLAKQLHVSVLSQMLRGQGMKHGLAVDEVSINGNTLLYTGVLTCQMVSCDEDRDGLPMHV